MILDEPTASLGVAETAQVHELVRDMRQHDLAVLMISHNLNHVLGVSDRITVMKAGRTVGSRVARETTQEEILRMILMGRDEREPAEAARFWPPASGSPFRPGHPSGVSTSHSTR